MLIRPGRCRGASDEEVGFQFILEEEIIATFINTVCGLLIRSLRARLSVFGFLDVAVMASKSPLMQTVCKTRPSLCGGAVPRA